MSAYTTVSRAVAIAVRVSCDLASGVGDLGAFAHQVGKRIQGAYGAELRRLAEADPAASAQDLYEAVILPAEFPWLAVENPHADVLVATGARDRARHARENPSAPPVVPSDDAWRAGLAAARASISDAPAQARAARRVEADAEFAAQMDELRAAARRGRTAESRGAS